MCLEKMEGIARHATDAKQVKMVMHYEYGEQRLFCFILAIQPVNWLSVQLRKALPTVAAPSEVKLNKH